MLLLITLNNTKGQWYIFFFLKFMIVYRVAQSNLRQKCTTDSNINDHFQFRFEDYRAYGTQLRTYFLPADYTDF